MINNEKNIISTTKKWIEEFVIQLQLCPFAHVPYHQDKIKYTVANDNDREEQLQKFYDEILELKKVPSISNAFFIWSHTHISFIQFYDFFLLAEALVERMKDDHLFQLVAFHPKFQFGEVAEEHPSNYTNRSPFPMVHILRVPEVEEAIDSYGDIEKLLDKNQTTLQKWVKGHQDSDS